MPAKRPSQLTLPQLSATLYAAQTAIRFIEKRGATPSNFCHAIRHALDPLEAELAFRETITAGQVDPAEVGAAALDEIYPANAARNAANGKRIAAAGAKSVPHFLAITAAEDAAIRRETDDYRHWQDEDAS